jgi:hypothetical protein
MYSAKLNIKIMMTSGVKALLSLFSVTFLLSATCNKTDDLPAVTNPCWQAFDPLGTDVNGLLICDKTKAETEAAWPQYWFYNAVETKYCWKAQQGTNPVFYAADIPQSMADKMWALYGYSYTKVDCSSFCKWQIIEKRKSKITGLFTPNRLYVETLFADTCSKLFAGKIVIYQETTDSLVTREFFKKL